MKANIFIILFLIIITNCFSSSDKYRLTYRDNPSTSIVIGWDNLSGNNHRVYFDTEDHGQDTTAYSFMKTPDRVENEKGMTNTFARLSNLQPNTKYYFVVADDGFISERMWFQTIPDDPSVRLSMIFGGDSRSHQDDRQNANKMVAKLRAHAVVFGGDYVDDGTDSQWEQWFLDWEMTISEDGRCTPLIATQGNHELIWTNFPEGNDVIDKLFDYPNDDHYFAMNFGGSLFRIYSLDSEYPTSSNYGDQTDWFEDDLAQNYDDATWLIAQFHSPVRPHNEAKMEGSKQYDEWVPFFDQYNFAFVHENDAHLCKRTWPIRISNGEGSEEGFIRDDYNGTVYVGEGGWGAPLRTVDDNKVWTRNSIRMNQFKWIFISQDTIEIRTVMTDSVDNTEALQEGDDVFSYPNGISIWNPSNGPVIIIQKWTIPECVITSPIEGAYFESPQEIQIEATATDEHEIQEVEFFVNNESIGSDNTEPYIVNYTFPYEGMFYLTARAINSQDVIGPFSQVVSVGCGELSNSQTIVTDDDAEENLENGEVDTGSGDLELIRESGVFGLNEYNQKIGIRFTNLNLPQGAIISNAYIQFKTDDTNNDNPCNLTISGEATVDAETFSESDNNISNRELTTASVLWSPPNWDSENEQGEAQQTPNISSIIQEIVDYPDWEIYNDIAIIISGEGRRTAKSGNAELVIEYTINILPQIILTNPTDQTIYTSLETIEIEANASDIDGEVSSVSFYSNGNFISQDFNEPYQASYTLPDYQTYDLYAIVTDNNSGEVESNHVEIIANTPPTVEMLVPASDTTVTGLPSIQLQASANDLNGNVTQVQFFTTNNTLIETDFDAPYECEWAVPYYGTFELKAVATDNYGSISTSETKMLTAEINEFSEPNKHSDVTIYPNPVKDILTINLDKNIGRDKPLVVLYNIEQKVLMQQVVKASSDLKIRIDMNKFSSGTYILQVKGKTYDYSFKLVIE